MRIIINIRDQGRYGRSIVTKHFDADDEYEANQVVEDIDELIKGTLFELKEGDDEV